MKKLNIIALISLGVVIPILANWTCSACGRENWDKYDWCRWCRAPR